MRVYVAGPLDSFGIRKQNVNMALEAASLLLEAGHEPFVPHLTASWHDRHPQPRERWLQWSMAWLSCCHALVRIPGASPGSDQEVNQARSLSIPVFFSAEEFLECVEIIDRLRNSK